MDTRPGAASASGWAARAGCRTSLKSNPLPDRGRPFVSSGGNPEGVMDKPMTVQEPIVLPVNESSQVAEARRLARDMATRAGLTEEQRGRAALIATEAATNLIKHGGGGEMILRLHEAPPVRSLDLIAVDRGRGMANMDECLRDGYSTIGTAGNGLGAIKRQSSRFDAYTRVGQGTVVFSRISSGPAPPGP